jgi:predicted NAD/FAD-dependent oxidoreductase
MLNRGVTFLSHRGLFPVWLKSSSSASTAFSPKMKTFASSSVSKQNEPVQPHVAIIGGGIAGLSAASKLKKLKINSTVFDMGTREPGGRACSRVLVEDSKDLFSFDHGAQFIAPISGGEFEKEVKEWVTEGVAAPWQGRFGNLVKEESSGNSTTTLKFIPYTTTTTIARKNGEDADAATTLGFCGINRTTNNSTKVPYVGIPNQGAIARHLAVGKKDAKVKIGHKVTGLFYNKTEKMWTVEGVPRSTAAAAATPASFGKFDAVVVADALVVLPDSAGYAIGLVQEEDHNGGEGDVHEEVERIVDQIQKIKHQPVFSLLVAFENTNTIDSSSDFEDFEDEIVPFDGVTMITKSGTPSSFQWMARNSSKPSRAIVGRGDGGKRGKSSTWVAITTPERSYELLKTWPLHSTKGVYNPQTHEYREAVAKELLSEFLETLETAAAGGGDGSAGGESKKDKVDLKSRVVYYHAQRWGRGFVENPLQVDYLGSQSVLFAACGDFCGGRARASSSSAMVENAVSPIESAWGSGQRAAEAVASWLSASTRAD